jgi:molybdopterin-guanine dinucleotide biosynthesis protein B
MAAFPLPLLGFCAASGTGKTTLLRQLLPLLGRRGLRLGLVKHAHHGFEPDRPGKDSYELRKAGAAQVVVASGQRLAWIAELPQGGQEPTLAQALSALQPGALDLVLVEGFKHEPIPKIELHRPSLGQPLFCLGDPQLVALASDAPILDTGRPELPLLDLNDPPAIAEFVVDYLRVNSR